MPKLLLHIGLGKTGTTAIQFWLAANAQLLRQHGWIYPAVGYFERGRAHHALSHKWGGWIKPTLLSGRDLDAEWRLLRDQIKSAPPETTFVVSSERFATASMDPRHADMLPYLSELFREIEVRVVLYLRRQDDLAEAYYRQMVKAGITTRPIDHFLENLPREFDFSELQERWSRNFGMSNLITRWYEPEKWPNGDVVDDFRDAIGIPSDTNYLPSERVNPSISASTAHEAIAGDINSKKNRARLLEKIRSEHDDKVGTLLDEKKRAEIMYRYKAK